MLPTVKFRASLLLPFLIWAIAVSCGDVYGLTCSRREALRCVDVLAAGFHLPVTTGQFNLPLDALDFTTSVEYIAEKSDGFLVICGYAFALFKCLGIQAAACFQPRFLINQVGLSRKSAEMYRYYFSELGQECTGLLRKIPRFDCTGHGGTPMMLGTFKLYQPSHYSNLFYICDAANIPLVGLCDNGQALNLQTMQCIPVRNFDLPMRLPKFDCPIARGNFSNPHLACSMFYFECNTYLPKLHICPDRKYFDSLSGICMELNRISSCRQESDAIPAPKLPNSGSSCFSTPSGNMASPRDPCSSSYFTCVGSIMIEQFCPVTLKYDSLFDRCDYIENLPVCGGDRPEPPQIAEIYTEEPTNAPTLFDDHCIGHENRHISNPDENCSETYFSCVGGIRFNRKCTDADFRFDPELGLCDDPKFIPVCGGHQN